MNATTGQAAGHRQLRIHNSAQVLGLLQRTGAQSRAQLADGLGLSRAAVSHIMRELMGWGLVADQRTLNPCTLSTAKSAQPPAAPGRPGQDVALNPRGGCMVGVDLNVDEGRVVLCDLTSRVLWSQRFAVDPARPASATLTRALTQVRRACALGREQKMPVLGVGVGVAGQVEAGTGRVLFAPNLGWSGVPLGARWAQQLGTAVFVENEARAAALGESYFGAARGAGSVLYLSIGNGVGGGWLLEGRLHRGHGGHGGEVGHMPADPKGHPCRCGQRGCWETQIGLEGARRTLRALATRLGSACALDMPRLETLPCADFYEGLTQAAAANNAAARAVFEHLATAIGRGVAGLVNAFGPQRVVVGGELAAAAPYVLPAALSQARAGALPALREGFEMAAGELGTLACAVGAATLPLDHLLEDPSRILDIQNNPINTGRE